MSEFDEVKFLIESGEYSWFGKFEGGPWDGSVFSMDAPPRMRRIQLVLGDPGSEDEEHTYEFRQSADEKARVYYQFVHVE